VLVGAVVLARLEDGTYPEAEFIAMMEAALSRPEDRKLLGLAVVEGTAQIGMTPMQNQSRNKQAARVKNGDWQT
jgi:hypothetical protein